MPLGCILSDMSSRWTILTTLLLFSPIWSIQVFGKEMMYVEPPVTCIFLSSSEDLSCDSYQPSMDPNNITIFKLLFTLIPLNYIESIDIYVYVWLVFPGC